MDKKELTSLLVEGFHACPGNVIAPEIALSSDVSGLTLFEEPLVGFGAADDPLFLTYQQMGVVGPWHWLPEDWLPGAKTVISLFFPFTEDIKSRERACSGWHTSEAWLHGRVEGQDFLASCLGRLCGILEEAGLKACAPSIDGRFCRTVGGQDMPGFPGVSRDAYGSNWSERHVAYLCGLGTFGLSKGIITEKGMAGRFGSIIIDLPLEADERPYTGLYDYCINCGACIARCPAEAITAEGKNHVPCHRRMDKSRVDYAPRYGCGKCQTAVPCESRNPTRAK